MRKILFFLFLFIIFCFVFKKGDNVVNKEILDNNINVNYPYFSSYNINNSIFNYINRIVSESNGKLIVDYDYDDINNVLTFYKTEFNGNVVNNKVNTFRISNNIFTRINNVKNTNEYDFYNDRYIDSNTKLIAFTFDDGPNYNTSQVIDILNKYNVTATFFVMGRNIKGNEKIIKKMYNSNMEIGNHTYNHLLLTKYNSEKISEEINKTNEEVYNVIGRYPTLLRTSYGSVNKKIKENVDMPIIIWNIDTLDWKYKNSNKIVERILDKVSDGDIVLMHDIYKATLNSLDKVIPELLDRGFQIVSVSELFYYKEIKLKNGKVYGFAK